MKILIVCQFYHPENFVITNIAEKLVSFGHEVTVLTGKPNYGYGKILPEYKKIKKEIINGVNVIRVKLLPRKKSRLSVICNYLSYYFSSRRWVRHTKEKFDVVYSFSLSPVTILSAANLYKEKFHVKHVVHCVDLWPESVVSTKAVSKNSLTYKILYRWSQRLYSGADEILIGSPSFKDYFINELKMPNVKLTYIPQCSLVEEYDGGAYNFNPNFTNIVYCGNIGLLQRIEEIPEIMKSVDPNVVFHIIGMGPKKDELLKEIEKRNMAYRVVYHGAMNSKKASQYLEGADALFISLKNEGFVGRTIPNKIMMSLAFKKPIIAMINGDGRDVLEKAKGSLICEENNANIAETINKFTDLPKAEKEKMANNNHQYYLNNFSQETVSKKVEETLLRNN